MDLEIRIAVLHERLEENKNALKLQAIEYERRLENLNHEARQLKDMQEKYLPREVHNNFVKDMTSKVEAIQRIVYIGVGVVLVLQILVKFIK